MKPDISHAKSLLNKITVSIITAILVIVGKSHALNEASVFEWWDDGLISAEEATEMLNLLEEGNQEEACLLAEAFSLESCTSEKPENQEPTPKSRRRNSPKNKTLKKVTEERHTNLTPHGYVLWKGRLDSLGHLESHRTELQVDFYRYRLRLGSQELLTYRNKGAEAHFGQISTREFHSHIPLDTLWGTSLQYPLGNFFLAGAIDTALNRQARLGYRLGHHPEIAAILGRSASVDVFGWQSRRNTSAGLQANTSWGQVSCWWQERQKQPLVKMQLHHAEDKLSWNISAYIHGDSVPEQARLSKSIRQNRLWSSQTVTYTDDGPWRTKLTANSRITVKNLTEGTGGSDSTTARFKLQVESGPPAEPGSILGGVRGAASATCLNAADNCSTDDLKLQATWKLADMFGDIPNTLSLQGSANTRFTQGIGLDNPHLELGSAYSQGIVNKASISIKLPQKSKKGNFQIQGQTDVGTDILQVSASVTSKASKRDALHPSHIFLQLRVFF